MYGHPAGVRDPEVAIWRILGPLGYGVAGRKQENKSMGQQKPLPQRLHLSPRQSHGSPDQINPPQARLYLQYSSVARFIIK